MNIEKEKEKDFILKRARAAVISRDFALAARLYKGLLKDDAGNISLLNALGNLYVKAGDDKKALLYYEQIRTLSPNNFDALNSMGGIYRRLKKYNESIDVLQKALNLGLNDPQVNYNLGFTYRSMGQYDEAIECFESVIDDNPNDVLAYNHLGAIYALRNDHEKAVTAYKRGLQVDPNHPILQLNLARSYEELHDDQDAASAYEAALRAKPGWLEAIRDYSELLLRHKQTRAAADLVKKSTLIYPNDIGLQNLLGQIYLKQDDYDSAEEIFEKAVKMDGDNTTTLSGLAEAYEKNNKQKDAVKVMEKAEKILPDNTPIARQYAHALLSANEADDAGLQIRKIYEKDKNDVKTLDLYGQYYICKDNGPAAEKIYSKINDIDPSYHDYKREASARYRQTGNLGEARKYIEKYIKHYPQDSSGLIALAQIDEASGNLSDALSDYHKALKYDQYNTLARQEVQRIGGIITNENSDSSDDPAFLTDADDEGEIVMDSPKEPDPENTETTEAAAEEDPFDFDSMGSNLVPDDDDDENQFKLSDDNEDDTEDEDKEKPEGLDQLVPADQPIDKNANEPEAPGNDVFDGKPGAAMPQPESAPDLENGFGSENIDEEPDNAVSLPYSGGRRKEKPAEQPAAEYMPSQDDDADEPALAKPEKEAQAPENDSNPDRETQDIKDSGIASGNEKKGENKDTPASLQHAYDVAQEAAERAWSAAQKAADSAQGVDSALDYINQMSEDTAMKAASEAVKKIQDAADKAEARLAELSLDKKAEPEEPEENQEQIQEQADDNGPDDQPDNSGDLRTLMEKASETLPGIVSMLEKKENAEKFMTELELFKKLRALCEYLPSSEKEQFMSSKTRLLLDYIIAKLSGKPGLVQTAEELRRSPVFLTFLKDEDMKPDDDVTSKELAGKVIGDMRKMVKDLPDAYLAKALDDSAAEALRTL